MNFADDPLLLILIGVCVLIVLVTVLCVVLVITVLRDRRKRAERPAAQRLPQGVDSMHADDVDITRVAQFLPSLAGDGDFDDDEVWDDESKALLRFEDDSWSGVDEPTGPVPLIVTSSAGRTDPGAVRRRNEDAFLVNPELDLYVVADGMGGYAGGDVASRLAVEAVRERVAAAGAVVAEPNYPRRGGLIKAAIEHANGVVLAEARNKRELEGMGTTLLAALFAPRKQRLYIGHVGDSRAYRLRAGALHLLTADHTLAARGVTGPLASSIRRAVGIAPTVKVDVIVDVPQPEDAYILCSDGLTKMVEDADIRKIVASESDPNRATASLIAAANAKGGRDNTTVIVVRVSEMNVNRHSGASGRRALLT